MLVFETKKKQKNKKKCVDTKRIIPQIFETEIIFFAAILLVAHLVGNNYIAGASSLTLSHTVFLSEEKLG